jgi:hypothetical protein
MLLRFAKVAGGLRLLIFEAGPIAVASMGLLSARTAAYLVGFGLSNIASVWLPIVATLISITGFFGAGANTAECEAFRAHMRAIDAANRAALASYQQQYKNWYDSGVIQAYYRAKADYEARARQAAAQICLNNKCGPNFLGYLCSACLSDASSISYPGAAPSGPSPPILRTYSACSSPNCFPGKKVWTQVLWASPAGNFTDTKGCFIVAYSQDAPTLPPTVEYNPFLPKIFVESRALSYYLVDGDRYRGLQDNDWKNLESVQGWDKGYWRSEVTDPECRGWRPGWSRKIK